MMLYDVTAQYQAERIMDAGEQRRADEQLGMMAVRVCRGPGSASSARLRILRGFLREAGPDRPVCQVKQSSG